MKSVLSKLTIFYILLCTLGAQAQDSTPAMLTTDGHGHGILAIPGEGTQFDIHTASTVFNSTRDDQLVIGYNLAPHGEQYSLTEPQIRLALEANYDDGINQNLEWNLDTVSADLSHARRWMYLTVNRANPMIGQWIFAGTSFTLQNYNSPSNDSPSEYFSVTSDGIARLTSRPGQPSQLQLNTSDSSGYPGSYACIVLQRGYQNKWIIDNEGANGDRLGIVGVNGEVASFTQTGAFTSKGQRTGVTTKSASYTAGPGDSEIRVNCAAGSVTITLPPATATGQVYRIKKIDTTHNAARIVCSGGDTIDGASSLTLSQQYAGLTVVDGGAGTWDRY